MENFDDLSFRELIRLRDALNREIDRKKEAKSDEVKVGQLYTQYQGDGSKYEHLVIDVYSEYMSAYEGYKEIVKSILYYVRPDGIVESKGVFNDDAETFVETVVLRDYAAPNSVRQTSIGDGEYAEALNKLETEFYKKCTPAYNDEDAARYLLKKHSESALKELEGQMRLSETLNKIRLNKLNKGEN